MSYRKITRTMYQCHCECIDNDGKPCGHDWESPELPERCARCKRYTWNGNDRRRKEEPAPKKKGRR